MSRTHVHLPYRVKVRHAAWRGHFTERHDHSTGPCDLGRFDPADWQATRCHIDLLYRGRNVCCGCRLCTGHDDRRVERRRDRHGARRQVREALKSR